ncbi:MAG: hypothetical protein PF495_17660, partial [Spirochaetales bacterium]|nr:hypothetical protein [Spirochaetales bacterium]
MAGLVQTFGIERLINWFVVLAYVSCLSVALFFYLFLNFGPGAVSFFKENSNLNLTNGNAAAIMFVYGSMIFMCGAFFSAPELIGKFTNRLLLLASLTIAALTSGRSALILSIPLGLFLGLLLSPRTKISGFERSIKKKCARSILLFFVILSALCLIEYVARVDFVHIIELYNEELFS